MDSLLKLIGGATIAVGIHLLVSSPTSATAVPSSCFALLSQATTYLAEAGDMSLGQIDGNWVTSEVKISSSYEPPVEGGPQSSQGSGTR